MVTGLLLVIAALLFLILIGLNVIHRSVQEALALNAMNDRDDAQRLRELVAGVYELQKRADERSSEPPEHRWRRG